MIILLLGVAFVLICSALCSCTEAALFSCPIIKVRHLAESTKSPAALAFLRIRESMNRPIATVVILNNIANIVGSIGVGALASAKLGSQWLGLFSAVLTLLIIVFAEIVPKTLGERYSAPIGLVMSQPLLALSFLFTPLIWCIEKVTTPFTQGSNNQHFTGEGQIKLLVSIGHTEGSIESVECEMIQKVFQLNDKTASDVMTPRVQMTCLYGEDTLEQSKDAIISSEHSRILIIGKTRDEILGMALKSELLTALIKGQNDLKNTHFVHKVQSVTGLQTVDGLLRLFQRTHQHLAVVLDEFGGVAGIVTLEDVLEVLTGEIMDESDTSADLQEIARKSRKVIPLRLLSENPASVAKSFYTQSK